MTTNGWAIVGWCGLYIGWWPTRREAIAAHVRDKRMQSFRGDDAALWKKCQKDGDRAVKVKITYR